MTHFKDALSNEQLLRIADVRGECRVDSRLLAQHLGNQHKALIQMLSTYKDDFQKLGKVPFQMEALPSGQKEKYALLTEDQ